ATHNCIVACDHNASFGATVWTEDGLYAGGFLDRHVDDLPDWCYTVGGHYYDSLTPLNDWSCGGSLTNLSDGSVMWFPPGIGRVAVYGIGGWDDWFRSTGKIEITASPPAASSDSESTTGLKAAYYRGTSFTGEPVHRSVDPLLWFSSVAPSWQDKRVANWA